MAENEQTHGPGQETGSTDPAGVPAVVLSGRAQVAEEPRADHGDGIHPALHPARRSWIAVLLVLLSVGGVLLITAAGGIAWFARDLPFARVASFVPEPVVVLEASNGDRLQSAGQLQGVAVTRSELPDHLVDALLAIEDRRFYNHQGLDLRGILRAAVRNISAGEVLEGGSTITQQVVRVKYLNSERSLQRKLREAVLAVWLDLKVDKDTILTGYLNSVYFGDGAHGISAAARRYFDKAVSDLTLPEAAILAGIIRSPSVLNPHVNRDAALNRARIVIDAMVATGALTEDEADAAKVELDATQTVERTPPRGGWFADWVGDEARQLSTMINPGEGNALRVHTTLDPELQEIAETVVNDVLATEGAKRNASEAALVALRRDGAVLAMVGGKDYGASQFNRAVQAKRQPGSAFKLFVYYAALRNGWRVNDRIENDPLDVDGWRPANYDGRYSEPVTLSSAFVRSLNIPAARLALEVGPQEVASAARDLGIDAELLATPSIALGTSEVSLLDITGAYASVRDGSTPIEPWGVGGVERLGEQRNLTPKRTMKRKKIKDEHRTQLIRLMHRVVNSGTGRAAAVPGFVAVGKTGTSEDHRDAWFIGFTKDLVVGVWVGNDDNSPMLKVTGGSLPAKIWQRFVSEASEVKGFKREKDLDAPAVASDNESYDTETVAYSSDADAPPPWCNVEACAARYTSFDRSDCSYQPYIGDRRACLIEKDDEPTRVRFDNGPIWRSLGSPRSRFSTRSSYSDAYQDHRYYNSSAANDPYDPYDPYYRPDTYARSCNYDACSRRYRSFRASDCTFQPYDGTRQFCAM